MQVIKCNDVLGWRGSGDSVVTRLVLYVSDQGFHYAGEGKVCVCVLACVGACSRVHACVHVLKSL